MPSKQPYEILIRFEKPNPGNPKGVKTGIHYIEPAKSAMQRSKTGCFNCRKIKKKCSEKKPNCERCENKGLKCVWPASKDEKLPEGYIIEIDPNKALDGSCSLTDQHIQPALIREETPVETLGAGEIEVNNKEQHYFKVLDEFRYQSMASSKIPNATAESNPMSITSVLDHSLDFLNTSPFIVPTSPFPLDTSEKIVPIRDSPSPGNYQSLEENYASGPSTPMTLAMPITSALLNTRSQFMYACLNGFINAVAPQYTHPSLTTTATFTAIFNQGNMNNNILEQVAYACGAAFLCWNKEDLTQTAMDLYDLAYQEITILIEATDTMRRDELIWVCGASQMLCLCAKILSKGGANESLHNLRNTYKVIKARIDGIEREKIRLKESGKDKNHVSRTERASFALDMLNMEIENECLGSQITIFKGTDMDDVALSRNQFERMFIESFIYNYSITLITFVNFEKLSQLPNPFQVFKELRTFLKIPIFKCEVTWMNNPVLGAALDAFELIAKTSYLLRQLDNPLTIPMAEKLLDIASYYPSSIIPLEIKAQNKEKYTNLKESVLMSDIALKCCKILLFKIIKFSKIEVTSPEIQTEVNSIIAKLKILSRGALVKRIAPWALFITGLMCVNSDEREFIVRELVDVGYDTHSRHINQIVKVLRDSWSKDLNKASGFDVLWDEPLLMDLAL